MPNSLLLTNLRIDIAKLRMGRDAAAALFPGISPQRPARLAEAAKRLCPRSTTIRPRRSQSARSNR